MKKSLGVLLFVVTGFVFSCKSSYTKIGDKNANYIPYYLKVYEADSLFIVGNYQRSYEILDSLFKKYEPIEIQGYYEYSNYVFSAVFSGNNQNIKKIAKKAYIDNGGLYTQQIKILKSLDSINRIIGFSNEEIAEFKEIYNSNLNWKLKALINTMNIEDQSIRGENFKNTEELAKLSEIHQKMIMEIFDKYGYPSTKKTGFGDNLWAVFLHTDPLSFKPKYLLPKLLDYIKNGEDIPTIYANTYDKWFYFNNEKYYYSPNEYNVFKGKELDSIRKSIGLPHKNYQKWKMDRMMKDIEEYNRKNTTVTN